ncbi:hypothetical protein [Streptomyces sp. 11-1-2]|uniref:hypothetical protein n=1 Tax=Streptomyces sp. 11-1-2 TaxID=1851167 RepID=UPI000B8D3B8D|nr:hypothetical protein [Streptomyces sp. 11-1-2]ASR00784.1 hypothetical protein CGL27_48860 [Streptomyces sp. 11-1-2]
MITVNPRLALLLSLLPLVLGRLRLVAAVAGGAWLVGIELSPAPGSACSWSPFSSSRSTCC